LLNAIKAVARLWGHHSSDQRVPPPRFFSLGLAWAAAAAQHTWQPPPLVEAAAIPPFSASASGLRAAADVPSPPGGAAAGDRRQTRRARPGLGLRRFPCSRPSPRLMATAAVVLTGLLWLAASFPGAKTEGAPPPPPQQLRRAIVAAAVSVRARAAAGQQAYTNIPAPTPGQHCPHAPRAAATLCRTGPQRVRRGCRAAACRAGRLPPQPSQQDRVGRGHLCFPGKQVAVVVVAVQQGAVCLQHAAVPGGAPTLPAQRALHAQGGGSNSH
jgi:hypothetical protein